MNPWTAICFVFAALALIGRGLPGSHSRSFAALFAAVPLLSGALKLFELVFKIPIGIDAIVFGEKLFDPALNAPSRMAPNTACNFLLLGIALMLLNGTSARAIKWSQTFALLVIANSGLALIGYGYGVPSLYGFGAFLPMAVHTASVFILLGMSVLAIHRAHGIVALVIEDGPAGAMARRMLAAAVTVRLGSDG
jgi:methyl-accepting chemotaxis protein